MPFCLTDALETTPENSGPSTLQIRVAIATALGAAAAHAKLVADQEEREMEHLMATIIEAQVWASFMLLWKESKLSLSQLGPVCLLGFEFLGILTNCFLSKGLKLT